MVCAFIRERSGPGRTPWVIVTRRRGAVRITPAKRVHVAGLLIVANFSFTHTHTHSRSAIFLSDRNAATTPSFRRLQLRRFFASRCFEGISRSCLARSLRVSLSSLRFVGFWRPPLSREERSLLHTDVWQTRDYHGVRRNNRCATEA